jgi:hypothetical protein
MTVFAVNMTLTYRVEGQDTEQAIEKALDSLRADLLNKSVSAGDFAIEAEIIPKFLTESGAL